MKNNIYYVYVYMDSRKEGNYHYTDIDFKFEPFYVGKGKNGRFLVHMRPDKSAKGKIIESIMNEGLKPEIIKLYENLTETEALDLESSLIRKIGRLDLNTGPLTNHTDGGEGIL